MNIILNTIKIKKEMSSVCQQIKERREQLINKQFYEKNSFFIGLNSYLDFFSRDLYNLFSYAILLDEDLKKTNILKFVYKCLYFFNLRLVNPIKKKLDLNKKKTSIINRVYKKIQNFFIKKKLDLKVNSFNFNENSMLFSYILNKSLFFYKTPILIPEFIVLFFIRFSVFILNQKQNLKYVATNNYFLAKTINSHKIVCRSFLDFIYYAYLLKKELTFSEFFKLKKFFFLNYSLVIFRKQLIEKTFTSPYKDQLKKDFFKTFKILKNSRAYSLC